MKRRTTPEDELHSAYDVYRHGPRAGFFIGGRLPMKRPSGLFSFSDRFIIVYFLVFIMLTVLGTIAVIKTH